jgi:hypothetical protein
MRLVMRLSILVSLAACSTHKVTLSPTNPAPHALSPRLAASVEIFTTARPQRPYVEVAVLTANYGEPDKDIEALRDRASSYGCDALVFGQIGSTEAVAGQVSSNKPGQPSQPVYGESVNKSIATCVVWTAPAQLPLAEPAQ